LPIAGAPGVFATLAGFKAKRLKPHHLERLKDDKLRAEVDRVIPKAMGNDP
jgi:hypothetical protein